MANEKEEKQRYELVEVPVQTELRFLDKEQNKVYTLQEAILILLNKK